MKKRTTVLALIAGSIIGALMISPAGAHVNNSVSHIWGHIRPLADARYVQLQDESYVKRDPAAYCTMLGEPLESYGPCASVGTSDITVDSNGTVISPSIAIGADGNPVISYHEDDSGVLKVARCKDRYCTQPPNINTIAGGNGLDHGLYSSIAIGADGFPSVSYYDDTANGLRFHKCNDRDCAPGGEVDVQIDAPSGVDVGRYNSLAIGTDDNPVISYHDETNGALKVAKCDDPTCGGGGEQINTVDNPVADVGEDTSIAIAGSTPVISYQDQTAGTLKFVKCDDSGCQGSGEQIRTLDDPAQFAGVGTSIAVGTDDLPIVSHGAPNPGRLFVVHCADTACSAGETRSEVAVFSATVTSLAIGQRGNPVIAVADDGTPGGLRTVSCNDQGCTGSDEISATVGPALTSPSLAIGTDGKAVIAYSSGGNLRVVRSFV